jgi:hypothetical protein
LINFLLRKTEATSAKLVKDVRREVALKKVSDVEPDNYEKL